MLKSKSRCCLFVFKQLSVTYFLSIHLESRLREVCNSLGSSAHPSPFKAITTAYPYHNVQKKLLKSSNWKLNANFKHKLKELIKKKISWVRVNPTKLDYLQ